MTLPNSKLRRQILIDSIVGASLTLASFAMLWTAINGYSHWLDLVASDPDRPTLLATSSVLVGIATPCVIVGIALLSCAVEDAAHWLRNRDHSVDASSD